MRTSERLAGLLAVMAAVMTLGASTESAHEESPLASVAPIVPQDARAALIARGDSIFRGRLGGAMCWTCHGQNAKGMPNMGPDLTDTVWLNVDGSVSSIEALIRTGVPRPKRAMVPMLPWGGGSPLDSAKLHAVATYVASLSERR